MADSVTEFCPTIDVSWVVPFAALFTVGSHGSLINAPIQTDDHRSQCFVGFDLGSSSATMKAYFLPAQRAARDSVPPWPLAKVTRASVASICAVELRSLDILSTFVASCPETYGLRLEIVAMDCVPLYTIRIKVYFRTNATSFDSVKYFITMAGTLASDGTAEALRDLRRLWIGVLELRPDVLDDCELPPCKHRTAGILYYFELDPGVPSPTVKVYIPVRHYAESDAQIARSLEEWFGPESKTEYRAMLTETLYINLATHNLDA